MKENIHPQYGAVTIQCACGNVIETRSTKERIQVEICSACHPFFTGRQKLVDTAGRIDRFKKKFGERIALGSQKKQKKKAKSPAKSLAKTPTKAAPAGVKASPMKEKLKKAKEELSKEKK